MSRELGVKKMKEKANSLILFLLFGVVISGLMVFFFMPDRVEYIRNQAAHLVPPTLVATDPSFPEVQGRLIEGFPEFPVYSGATLIGSARTSPVDTADTGYRTKWTAKDDVPTVMKWYQAELPKIGWKIELSGDPANTGEQVVQISKGELRGYLGIEAQSTGVEIIVEVRK